MQQVSLSYAVRSIVAWPPPADTRNLEISDSNTGVSPVPKMSASEADVVPMGRPDASSSLSVSMSL